MQVWHLTADASREPRRVTLGARVNLRIGTWPVEPGQQVIVEYRISLFGGLTAVGRAGAQWVETPGRT